MNPQNHQNPGTTNPADQSYPPTLRPSTPTTPASSSTINSSGDLQLPCQNTAVAPTGGPQGLPAEVNAGHASQIRSQPAVVAETFPPARSVSANTDSPGGLPKNVNVK